MTYSEPQIVVPVTLSITSLSWNPARPSLAKFSCSRKPLHLCDVWYWCIHNFDFSIAKPCEGFHSLPIWALLVVGLDLGIGRIQGIVEGAACKSVDATEACRSSLLCYVCSSQSSQFSTFHQGDHAFSHCIFACISVSVRQACWYRGKPRSSPTDFSKRHCCLAQTQIHECRRSPNLYRECQVICYADCCDTNTLAKYVSRP